MRKEKFVSIDHMKASLARKAGVNTSIKITRKSGDVLKVYIRGFADPKTNILLFSESYGSVGLRIMEVKDIRTVEFTEDGADPIVHVLHAKWLRGNPIINLLF